MIIGRAPIVFAVGLPLMLVTCLIFYLKRALLTFSTIWPCLSSDLPQVMRMRGRMASLIRT